MVSSVGDLGETTRRERRQLAAILARPRSVRQSSMASKQWFRRGEVGGMMRDVVVKRMVHAIKLFFAQGRADSVSRRCALARIERKR